MDDDDRGLLERGALAAGGGDTGGPEIDEDTTCFGCYLWVGILLFCLLVLLGCFGLAWAALGWLVGMLPAIVLPAMVVC